MDRCAAVQDRREKFAWNAADGRCRYDDNCRERRAELLYSTCTVDDSLKETLARLTHLQVFKPLRDDGSLVFERRSQFGWIGGHQSDRSMSNPADEPPRCASNGVEIASRALP